MCGWLVPRLHLLRRIRRLGGYGGIQTVGWDVVAGVALRQWRPLGVADCHA
jgi:hypothetical protein